MALLTPEQAETLLEVCKRHFGKSERAPVQRALRAIASGATVCVPGEPNELMRTVMAEQGIAESHWIALLLAAHHPDIRRHVSAPAQQAGFDPTLGASEDVPRGD